MKTLQLIIALIFVGVSIYYFEIQKPERISLPEGTPVDVVPVVRSEEPVLPAVEQKEEGLALSESSAEKPVNKSPKLAPALKVELDKSKKYQLAKEIVNPSGFINTDGLKIQDLVGKKVILVDFWTYSCINCQRTTPYLNAWYEKYKESGLEIIGVHTPEFAFEKERVNVEAAVKKEEIVYPVVMDNEYATWSAYSNRYWPRKYLIDIDGYIVFDHIGEGLYSETEKIIQALLAERAAVLKEKNFISTDIVKPNSAEELRAGPISPETYFGAWRNNTLINGIQGKVGVQSFSLPTTLKTSGLYFAGDWNVQREYAESVTEKARIIFKYQAKNVFFVAGADTDVVIKVLRDGVPVVDAAGKDVIHKNGESIIVVKEERLYKLIEENDSSEHVLELIIENPGLRAFTFTFG